MLRLANVSLKHHIVNKIFLKLRLPTAKFDAKFFNFFARLFILFYRSPMYGTFRMESKIK